MKFDLDDIIIVPETISYINSRSEVDPYDHNNMLPIMTAPMDTVVDQTNWTQFNDNKIITILSRSLENKYSYLWHRWYSYGFKEFQELFLVKSPHTGSELYALIDVANGNMQKLFEFAKGAKEKYKNKLVLMVGNVANPKTFEEWCKAGIDYVRCGVGNGNGCLTSANTGIGYPMASLIQECYQIKKNGHYNTKIVADGGFKKYADIIKAICLGADYVMLGSMFNKALESCGNLYAEINEYYGIVPIENWRNLIANNIIPGYSLLDIELKDLMYHVNLYKKFRGMSTKGVQSEWGRINLKTSEGITKFNKVEYTLKGFTENLEDYLRSAMSYTNSKTLEEFRGSKFEIITQNSFNRFNK